MTTITDKKLKTFMSQVFFRCPGSKEPEPLKRSKSSETKDLKEVFLFDDLLGGGIVVPDDIVEARFTNKSGVTPGLLMLVAGAPGSGKTTFALELCYRLSFNDNSDFDKRMKNGISSIYVSAEASARSIVQNAISYGWDEKQFYILPTKPKKPKGRTIDHEKHQVFIFGRDTSVGKGETAETTLESLSGDWWLPSDIKAGNNSAEDVIDFMRGGWWVPSHNQLHPQILVIDSLNTLGKNAPQKLKYLLRTCSTNYLLTIVIMDTGPGITPEHRWVPSEYMSDIEIDFSYDRPENYMIRRLWIVKARFQDHADGWHRMKINPRPTGDAVPNPLNPVIKEGGIFVFPSVHRHLSLARGELDEAKAGKKMIHRHPNPIETPFLALSNAIQGQGFPNSACTAIIGDRGGMKSHLAYYTLLKYLQNPKNKKKRAIIISLRDTENAALDTLADILWQQVGDNGKRLDVNLDDRIKARKYITENLIEKDRLEILYFWSGYISPEEFFHLVCTNVDRPGQGKDKVEIPPAALLVINGLEQLSARFPLCAKESMFISGLLSVLTVKGVTVLVTSGGLTGLPPEQGGVPAGLLPMSDLIIQTSFRLLPADGLWSHDVWFPSSTKYENPVEDVINEKKLKAKGKEPHVVYEIIREPGARECRRRVLFYMGREGDPEGVLSSGIQSGFVRGSVYVRPLPDEFPYGEKP